MFTASVREPMIGVGWNWSAAHYSDALPLYQLDDPGSGGQDPSDCEECGGAIFGWRRCCIEGWAIGSEQVWQYLYGTFSEKPAACIWAFLCE